MNDSFNRNISYLRLSVTDRCNLRCRYCMPEQGICKKSHSDMLTEDEMIQAVEAAASLGINKVRVTGGEPLIKKNILSICQRLVKVKGIDEVGLTTNGILLPEYADRLKEIGINRINISLDTLDSEKYTYITRQGNINQALDGINAAINAHFEHIKINTVLIGGFNDNEILSLAELTKQYPVDVRFIELMPMTKDNEFGQEAYISCDTVLKALPDLDYVSNTEGVAKLYHLPDAHGNIGIISSVSNHFCESCNRIRLTADGKIKPCLHSNQEFSIKGMGLNEMRLKIKEAIEAKPACHGPLSSENMSLADRFMNQIGG